MTQCIFCRGSVELATRCCQECGCLQPLKYRLSRRAVLIALGFAGLAAATGGCDLWTVRARPLIYRGHQDKIVAVAWSPDGQRIASGSWDRTVQVWDALDGEHPLIYRGHSGPVTAVAWSPNGHSLASGGFTTGSVQEGTVQLWEPASGKTLQTFQQPGALGPRMAWSPDGHYLITAGPPVFLRDIITGFLRSTSPAQSMVSSIAWSPNGNFVASAGVGADRLQIWNALAGSHLFTLPSDNAWAPSIALSPDSRYVVITDKETVQVWEIAAGTLRFIYHGHSADVQALAWSPDGSRIASAGFDGTVQVWDALTGAHPYIYTGHSTGKSFNIVWSIAWSPDGRHIASGGEDATVQVWQPE